MDWKRIVLFPIITLYTVDAKRSPILKIASIFSHVIIQISSAIYITSI